MAHTFFPAFDTTSLFNDAQEAKNKQLGDNLSGKHYVLYYNNFILFFLILELLFHLSWIYLLNSKMLEHQEGRNIYARVEQQGVRAVQLDRVPAVDQRDGDAHAVACGCYRLD